MMYLATCVCTYTLDMHIFPVSSSVTEATATLGTPRTLYAITVTCTIHPDSTADQCVVMATANGQTLTGNEYMCIYMHTYI